MFHISKTFDLSSVYAFASKKSYKFSMKFLNYYKKVHIAEKAEHLSEIYLFWEAKLKDDCEKLFGKLFESYFFIFFACFCSEWMIIVFVVKLLFIGSFLKELFWKWRNKFAWLFARQNFRWLLLFLLNQFSAIKGLMPKIFKIFLFWVLWLFLFINSITSFG